MTKSAGHPRFVSYDFSDFTFARSVPGDIQKRVIRSIEWITGKIDLLQRAKIFEDGGRVYETTFWDKVCELLEISVDCPEDMVARIPATGPVVMVANHPFGAVDGMVMANLASRIRPDLKILTRAYFTRLPELEQVVVPVAFPHDEDMVERNIEMRKEVMAHLADGGLVIVFPAGRSATKRTLFGPVLEHEWHPFTAKIILRSNARVLPVYFSGENGWAWRNAAMFSATLRQSLMMYEIKRRIGDTVSPIIGHPIERTDIDPWLTKLRGFSEELRAHTLSLKNNPDAVGLKSRP